MLTRRHRVRISGFSDRAPGSPRPRFYKPRANIRWDCESYLSVQAFRLTFLAVVAAALVFAAGAAASPARHSNLPCDPACGPADLLMQGTMSQTIVAVGDTLVWYLQVNDQNQGPALGVYVNITLPTNVSLVTTYSDRGTGCTSTGPTTLHCDLDWLADSAPLGHVTITTKVTDTGDHALTAVAGYRAPDPTPADNTLTLTATTPTPPPPPVLPVIAAGTVAPIILVSGKKASVSFAVTRSDNNAILTDGTMLGTVTVAKKSIASVQTFANGVAKLTFVLPKKMKGKAVTAKVTVTTADGSASKGATFHITK